MATETVTNPIDPDDSYMQLLKLSEIGEGVLHNFYGIDKAAFNINIINKIVLLCQKKEYGIKDLLELRDITKLTIFNQYIDEKNIDRINHLEKYIDVYLSAICRYKNQNYHFVRNKLLPLLRLRTKPPFSEPDLIAKGTVSLKYPETNTKRKINNNIDIIQMIRSQQSHIRNTPYELLARDNRSNNYGNKQIILSGSVFLTLATTLVNLQNVMLKNNNEMGFYVKPFLEVNTLNWEI
ncbi:uncharacterized protein LOC130665639 [Microplitis mediator]|uniref:uncharacterized protein LOC130665639 n=1 Tax=Microplitis mediator TaxID=375433 RepID=UPI002552E703|nr:uncharacterized protein LOC130665639 [Microplitis mediator]